MHATATNPNPRKPWFDSMYDSAKSLREVSDQLNQLATAFRMVGNSETSDKLYNLAEAVQIHSEELRRATAAKISSDYHEAVQGSANVIKACLAVGKKTHN